MSTQETTDTRNLITRLAAMTAEEIHRAAEAWSPSRSLPDDTVGGSKLAARTPGLKFWCGRPPDGRARRERVAWLPT